MTEAYKALQADLDARLSADKRLQRIAEKARNGAADFSDTAEYSNLVSAHLSEVLQAHIGEIRSPLGKELACKELLRGYYDDINAVLGDVQASVDEQLGIHILPQKAAFPEERVHRVAHALEDVTADAATILRRAGAPVANVARSFHDDYIRENAEFRSNAGLLCHIVRRTDGNCCAWCSKIAGRYVYGEEPHDVYRRHDNCGCTVTYENGRVRQDVWTKKTWETGTEEPAEKSPTVLTPEQGKELEQRRLAQFRGLTSGEDGGIIEKKPLKIGMQFFAKNSKDFETIILQKAEYAHVMSEIATHITPEQASKKVFKKAIGNYIYTVENNDFGNYRIIGKDEIE